MGIYIKGMKMPKSCFYCQFRKKVNPEEIMCLATGEIFEEAFVATKKMRNATGKCPLVEVEEPHGRLIDGDALDTRVRQAGGMGNVEEECTEDFNDGVLFVLDYFVKNAPTVIAREDGETNVET